MIIDSGFEWTFDKTQDFSYVVHGVCEIFHSVIFHKCSLYSVLLSVVQVKVQVSRLHTRNLSLYGWSVLLISRGMNRQRACVFTALLRPMPFCCVVSVFPEFSEIIPIRFSCTSLYSSSRRVPTVHGEARGRGSPDMEGICKYIE